jgi:hypothetical protein
MWSGAAVVTVEMAVLRRKAQAEAHTARLRSQSTAEVVAALEALPVVRKEAEHFV